ncbi:MAG TPA: PIN domain-containing protein [Ktedonobacteraceae bacterium]|nr:PIN domain-containing protein [Ktedonobacteraceae bacterium]
MATCFLDTNILLRYLVGDNQQMAEQALNLLMRVERGEEKVVTSSLVIFETIFTLQSFYRVPRQQIKEQVLPIISLRGLHLPDKSVFYKALDLYVTKNISFADAYNAAYMISEEVLNIYSWDRGFDKIDGIIRLEPQKEER